MSTPKEMTSADNWALPMFTQGCSTRSIRAIQADALEWCLYHVLHDHPGHVVRNIEDKLDELRKAGG